MPANIACFSFQRYGCSSAFIRISLNAYYVNRFFKKDHFQRYGLIRPGLSDNLDIFTISCFNQSRKEMLMNAQDTIAKMIKDTGTKKGDLAAAAGMLGSQLSAVLKNDMRVSTFIRVIEGMGFTLILEKDDVRYEVHND